MPQRHARESANHPAWSARAGQPGRRCRSRRGCVEGAVHAGRRPLHAGDDRPPRAGARHDGAGCPAQQQRRDQEAGAAHRAVAGRRDQDDAGVADRPWSEGAGPARAPRARCDPHAGYADRRGDGAPGASHGAGVRPALPRIHDQAPRGCVDHGAGPVRAAGRGSGIGRVCFCLGRGRRSAHGDRSDARGARPLEGAM